MTHLPGNRDAQWGFLGDSAAELGFIAVGAAAAGPVPAPASMIFERWIAAQHHGAMGYLERHRAQRLDPRHHRIVAAADAVVCVALPYAAGAARGGFWDHVAAHARGRDYHATVRERLGLLGRAIEARFPGCRWRAFVDSAPVMERTWAVSAGLGAIGRHGGLIVPGAGARVVLGEIVCSGAPRPEVQPPAPRFALCDDCELCVAACPTAAIAPGGEIDARRCLSYQTIEHRGPEPLPDVARTASLIFGCDECTGACPLENARLETMLEPPWRHGPQTMTLDDVLDADPLEIEGIIAGTCLERGGAENVRRNARAIASRRGPSATHGRDKEEP